MSVMQESLDQLALSMFDSLRLIPFSEEVQHQHQRGARGPQPQQPGQAAAPPLRRAVVTNADWAKQVQSLAEGVLKQAKALDGLIDALPGAELREDQQMKARNQTFTPSKLLHNFSYMSGTGDEVPDEREGKLAKEGSWSYAGRLSPYSCCSAV